MKPYYAVLLGANAVLGVNALAVAWIKFAQLGPDTWSLLGLLYATTVGGWVGFELTKPKEKN